MKTILKKVQKAVPLVVAGLWLVSCGSGVPAGGNTGVNYTQIERLARPAINEGLIVTNTNLNLWNSIPPSADLSTSNGQLNAVASEAIGTLTAVVNLAVNVYAYLTSGPTSGLSSLWSVATFNQGTCASPYTNCSAKALATVHALQFVPDVMRIDVSKQWATPGSPDFGTISTVNGVKVNSGDAHVLYNACVNGSAVGTASPLPLLCGGRKIEDNTIAITLSYLTFGASFLTQTFIGGPTFNTTSGSGNQYLVSDGYSYSTKHSVQAQESPAAGTAQDRPAVLAGFPYLGAPYVSQ